MDTYPCPNCGGVADEVDGCHRCGRAHDPVAARLAKLREAMADLDDETRRLDADRHSLDRRRQRLQRQRQELTRAIAQRLADERADAETTAARTAAAPTTTTRIPGQGRPPSAGSFTPGRVPVPRPPTGPTPPPGGSGRPGGPAGGGQGPGPAEPSGSTQPAAGLGPPGHPAETSPRSAQNAQLTLGGVLLAIAAVVIAGLYYTSTASGERAAVLGIATTVFLGVPVVLTRSTLVATAETIASIGLLLVLLDGFTAYKANLAGIGAVPPALYAAILFALITGVAAAYRFATHLRAPQFAALLTVQPLLPLVALNFHVQRTGFAAIFAVVAGFNLGAVVVFGLQLRVLAAGRLRPRPRQSTVERITGVGWPRMLRELAWLLFGLSLTTSVALATDSLMRATTPHEAAPAALALILAALIGLAAGQLQNDDRLRMFAGGAATFAIIAAVTRVNYLALPEDTLVLTAALAAAIALAARALPSTGQRGPQLGAVVAAALAGMVVVVDTVRTTAAVIAASTQPRVWSADLSRFAAHTSTASWQVPLAAILLAAFAVLVVPPAWRVDTAVLGVGVVVLAAPGTGALAWWVPAVLGVLTAAAANASSLYSRRGRDALVRSSTAAVIGLYAMVASLARPELTAVASTALAAAASATVVVAARRPERFGPFRERVSDSAFGAAAFTVPVAVATFVWLATRRPDIVLPITMVVTALGALGAAVSQVVARVPRTASAGGALAAAVGGLLFSLLLPGTHELDTAVSLLIVVAALATTASRIFEVSTGGVAEALRTLPEAVSALEEAVEGHPEVVEPPRRRMPTVDSSTLSAALATAALIAALARLAAALVPGVGLVTTEAMVLLAAVALRILPEPWRRGPRVGGVAVGGGVGLFLAAIAVTDAARAVAASTPFWSADLAHWTQRVASSTPYGFQVPLGLLLAAAAIWALLPPPYGEDLGFVTFCVAALSLPATAGLPWWAPVLIAGVLAITAGLGASLVPPGSTGMAPAIRRLILAFVLGVYGVLVAGATAASTGLLLGAYVAAGVLIAGIARLRAVAALVPAAAAAVSLAAAPGIAATTAAATGSPASGVLAGALLVAAVGVPVSYAARTLTWGPLPALGVGAAATATAVAAAFALPSYRDAQTWSAAAALIAVAAVAAGRARPALSTVDGGETGPPAPRHRRAAAIAIVVTALPAATLAAVASAPAWLDALVGPYRTLQDVWHGYGTAPTPERAAGAMATLLLLAGATAVTAVTLGGARYVLAAVLPPLAAMAVLAPAAATAPVGTTSWVALAVAVLTGLGAAMSPPVLPSAAHLLRGTAGIVCLITGGAGLAGSLATRPGTLLALGILVASAATAATVGRDPNARMVAWFVAAAAAFAFPVTALAASGGQLRTGAFYVLAICGALSGTAWQLARSPSRRGEAAVLELSVALGATFALLLTLGSPRYAAAVLTIWGLLLGVAALRRDRSVERRRWLVRAALAAELFACWVLLYSVRVPLTEAYTLPFAAVALIVGALELRYNDELSSWLAYGPALVGGFGPSVVLVLIGHDSVARWVTLLVVAVLAVIVGASLRLSAPVVTGSTVAVVVALAEMIRLLARGQVAGGLLVAIAGGVLVGFGAVSERRRRSRVR